MANTRRQYGITAGRKHQPEPGCGGQIGPAAGWFLPKVIWALLFGWFTASTSAEVPTAARRAIETANKAYCDALERRDHKGLAELYADKARLMPPGVAAITGRSAIESHYRQLSTRSNISLRMELETVELQPAGEFIIETGKHTVRVDDQFPIQGNYLVVWKEENGNWRIHREIGNFIGTTPEARETIEREQQQLAGVWRIVAHELEGRQLTREELKKQFQTSWMEISGNKIVLHDSGGVEAEARFEVDPLKSPRTLDLQLLQGKGAWKKHESSRSENIYELDGDTLKVCWTLFGVDRERPREFSTDPESGLMLVVYKRDKKEVGQCRAHLEKIYAAIQDYRRTNKRLPDYFSDLVPRFLPDKEVFLCPSGSREKIEPLFPELGDPNQPSHYIYEFSSRKLGREMDPGTIRMADWKAQQMAVHGGIVPILRCLVHEPVLNVSFDGQFFESSIPWELDRADTVELSDTTPAGIRLRLARILGTAH